MQFANRQLMSRLHSPQMSANPFHITGRRHNKAPFDLELDLVWSIMSDHLYLIHIFYGIKIHAFVLMPNHFHLICSTDCESLGVAFNYFMRETSKVMNRYSGKINQNWGSRYYRCEISNFRYFMNCYKYVYQNPVRAQLTSKCENWKFSSLNGLIGRSYMIIPIEADTILFTDSGSIIEENIDWLNQQAEENNLISMRKALKKRAFKLPKNSNKKAHFLENGLL